jgi:hypothetical protein
MINLLSLECLVNFNSVNPLYDTEMVSYVVNRQNYWINCHKNNK